MEILEILRYVLILILFIFTLYFRKNEKRQKIVADITRKTITLLKQEQSFCQLTEEKKQEKLMSIVNTLKPIVPTRLKKIINEDFLYDLVSQIYNEIEECICNNTNNPIKE